MQVHRCLYYINSACSLTEITPRKGPSSNANQLLLAMLLFNKVPEKLPKETMSMCCGYRYSRVQGGGVEFIESAMD